MNEIVNEKEPGMELNLQDLLQAYLRRWKLIAVCAVLGIAIALSITAFCITPMYQAGITIYVNNNRATEDKQGLSSGDLSASIYLVKGYMVVAKSDPVLEKVVEQLGGQYDVESIHNAISVQQNEDTAIFSLNVTHAVPEAAQSIANALADVILEEGPKVIEGTSARLVNAAKVPTVPSSPSYSSNTLLGAAGGLLLAVIYVTIIFLKDTRIKDENDLMDMFDLPILGRIPDFDGEFAGSGYSYSEEKE